MKGHLVSFCVLILFLYYELASVSAKSASLSRVKGQVINGRPSLVLDLPNEIEFEAGSLNYYNNTGTRLDNLTLQHGQLTLTGLGDSTNELSYNTITRGLELGLFTPNFRVEGHFELEGYLMWCPWGCEVTEFNVTGTLHVTNGMSDEPANTIFLQGRLQKDKSPILFDQYEVKHDYAISVSNVQGTIDGAEASDSSTASYLNSYFLSNVTLPIRDQVEDLLQKAFSNLYMEELLAVTESN
jgi:hypothetical protein